MFGKKFERKYERKYEGNSLSFFLK